MAIKGFTTLISTLSKLKLGQVTSKTAKKVNVFFLPVALWGTRLRMRGEGDQCLQPCVPMV